MDCCHMMICYLSSDITVGFLGVLELLLLV